MSDTARSEVTPSFCQSPSDLDLRTLFLESDVELMISRIAKWNHSPLIGDRRAKALGIIPNVWNDENAILPAEIEFAFMEPWKPGAGFGAIDRDEHKTSPFDPAFTASFVIFDPDQAIYNAFLGCMEHAAISGYEYASLTLHRDPNPVTRDEMGMRLRLDELSVAASMTPLNLPEISFYGISFTDSVTLRAPRWSYSW